MLNFFRRNLRKYYNSKRVLFFLSLAAVILACATYYVISLDAKAQGPDPSKVIGFILADLVVFLILGVLLARKLSQNFLLTENVKNSSRLQNRIIVAFSLVATIPTIIVAVFSTYFFNFGIQLWFDKKISAVLDQSIIVAESYIAEHKLQLRETALSVAEDLSDMYYDLIHNPALFTKTLNTEAEMRSLDEAIVLNRATNTIIANTFLSFSLSFATIPAHLIKKADLGEIVEIQSDPTKIRMLVKLKEHNDIFLLVGRLVDNKIIEHINKTNGAAAEYYLLKNRVSGMQIKFSIIFIFIALLLLLAAISYGIIFTTRIVNPLKKLVVATNKVKNGDLAVQVSENNIEQDEIGILSSAFNRMIKQLNRQQRDLVIAERALAWSDVARKVAHEIKNPLTPIYLASERLIKKFSHQVEDKVEFDKYMQMIIRHTADINKIVSEFVNFARLPTAVLSSCELVILIKNLVESRKLINEKISYQFTTDTPSIDFFCDVTQINQIMVNLLKNAEEAIAEAANIRKGYISVNITSISSSVTISVADNGIGFPVELVGKASGSYVKTAKKGMGIGLAIVRKIAQEHCATLNIENKLGGGAIVDLVFNLEELKHKATSGKTVNI